MTEQKKNTAEDELKDTEDTQSVDEAVDVNTSDGSENQESTAAEFSEQAPENSSNDSEASKEAPGQEDKSQADAEEWKGKYYRLHAEWDTYRRRMNEQREQEKALACAQLVESLLPVIDDFERTIAYAENNGESGLFDGVKAVHSKILDVFKSNGVEVLDPKGEAFNALEAQAVGTVEDASVPRETVVDVYQKGYRMGSKVIREAMVTVSSGGPKREDEEDSQE